MNKILLVLCLGNGILNYLSGNYSAMWANMHLVFCYVTIIGLESGRVK